MECSTRWGVVQQVSSFPNRKELLVQVERTAKACFPKLPESAGRGIGAAQHNRPPA